jgi:RNA polymerase sigma-70 factor (ECF subfamily)
MEFAHALARESTLLRDIAAHGAPVETETPAVSFERLVADEQAYVARLVHRLLGYRDEVDDVVQDVFAAALVAWPSFRGESSARTWLSRIAINRCRRQYRKRLLGRGLIEKIRRRWISPSINELAADSAVDDANEIVRRALAALGPRDRELLVLHYLQELSLPDVARMVGASHNAVEVRLSRARKRLKVILENESRDRR